MAAASGGGSAGRNLTAVETAVWEEVVSRGAVTPWRLERACAAVLDGVAAPLLNTGVVPDDRQAAAARLWPALMAALPAILGLTRLAHRLPQHRPVALLGLMCAAPVLIGGLMMATPARRSRGGTLAVSAARERHRALTVIGFRRAEGMRPADMALAVALFGPRPLRDNGLAWLADLLWPTPSGGGDGGSIDVSGGGDWGGGGGHGGDPF